MDLWGRSTNNEGGGRSGRDNQARGNLGFCESGTQRTRDKGRETTEWIAKMAKNVPATSSDMRVAVLTAVPQEHPSIRQSAERRVQGAEYQNARREWGKRKLQDEITVTTTGIFRVWCGQGRLPTNR